MYASTNPTRVTSDCSTTDGHASVSTTGRYVSTNVKMKRDVLQSFWRRSGLAPRAGGRWRPAPDVIAFLSSL